MDKYIAYLFSSESVSEGHLDRVADQVSDTLLDQFLAYNEGAHCAIGTSNTTGQVVIMGEVRSREYVDLQIAARRTINKIGYTKTEYQLDGDSCGVLSAIHGRSGDINRGVDSGDAKNQGAGGRGMMFGYACNETDNYMPVALDLARLLMTTSIDIHKGGKQMTYLRPDSENQMTVEYNDNSIPQRIDTIVVSTQYDDSIKPADDSREAQLKVDREMVEQIHKDVPEILMPRIRTQIASEKVFVLFNDNIRYPVNPTGKFVIGGPHGDTGLTDRKIIIDTYGSKGGHGSGIFSGKGSSKVDHSAAYAARYIARSMVAAGLSGEILVQLAYAIGVAESVNVYVNTYGRSYMKATDDGIAEMVKGLFDLHPEATEKILKLRQPIYLETAVYGHMGCQSEVVKKTFENRYHEKKTVDVELLTWGELDRVGDIKKAFGF